MGLTNLFLSDKKKKIIKLQKFKNQLEGPPSHLFLAILSLSSVLPPLRILSPGGKSPWKLCCLYS